MKTAVAAAVLTLAAAPAAAHIGDHAQVSGWHFVLEPVHILPALALAAVAVVALVWRERRRAAKTES